MNSFKFSNSQNHLNKKYIIVQVLNGKCKPIINTKMLLINCNKKIWVTTNGNGIIYMPHNLCGIYELRMYINQCQYLFEKFKISCPGTYKIKLVKYSSTTLFGYIYDENNTNPIEGATVVLFKYSEKEKKYVPIKNTLTDSCGNYHFSNLKQGFYFIQSIK